MVIHDLWADCLSKHWSPVLWMTAVSEDGTKKRLFQKRSFNYNDYSTCVYTTITQHTDVCVKSFALHHIISEASLLCQHCLHPIESHVACSNTNRFLLLYEVQTDPFLQKSGSNSICVEAVSESWCPVITDMWSPGTSVIRCLHWFPGKSRISSLKM